jgi:hypothetical protein
LDQYALLIINYVVGTGNLRCKAPHHIQVRKKERKKEREKERKKERQKERKKERKKPTNPSPVYPGLQHFHTSHI